MPERIVLAVDGGAASAAALEWTLAYACRKPVDVRLVTIDESPFPEDNPSARLEAVRALGQAVGRLTDVTPRSKIEMVMRHGGAADVLATESRTADLIVIGSDRVGPLSGVFSATLPLRLAPRTECPVGDRHHSPSCPGRMEARIGRPRPRNAPALPDRHGARVARHLVGGCRTISSEGRSGGRPDRTGEMQPLAKLSRLPT